MNIRETIKFIRDDYVDQFDAMVAMQRAKRSDVQVGRRMERPDSGLFGKLYVPDVAYGDSMTEWSDMIPRERSGKIPTFRLETPTLLVDFEDLEWDAVRLDHDGQFTGKLVSWWFNRWMPRADASMPRDDGVEGVIHSVTVDEKWISADLGTSAIDSLFNLLSVAQQCGASHIRVSSSRSS